MRRTKLRQINSVPEHAVAVEKRLMMLDFKSPALLIDHQRPLSGCDGSLSVLHVEELPLRNPNVGLGFSTYRISIHALPFQVKRERVTPGLRLLENTLF